MFGGLDDWLAERGEKQETVLDNHRTDVIDALASFCTGSAKDRKLFDSALAAITDDDKRAEFVAEWDDKKRSSLNDWTNYAHKMAESLRKK